MKRILAAVLSLSLVLIGAGSGWSESVNAVISVGVEKLDQEDLVTIKTKEEVHYTYFKLPGSADEPNRIVVDILGAVQRETPSIIPVETEAIRQIRTSVFKKDRVRIVLDLTNDYPCRVLKSGANVFVYVKNPLRKAGLAQVLPLSPQELIRKYYAAGKEAYIRGDYTQAGEEFKKILIIDSSHTWAQRYIAEMKEEERAFKKKAKEMLAEKIKQVERIRVQEFTGHYEAGKAYFAEKKYFEAIDEFKKAEKVGPKDSKKDIFSFIEKAQRRLQREKKADKDVRIKQLILEGQNYYSTREYEEAKKSWAQILVIDPYSKEAAFLTEKANRAIWQGEKRRVEVLREMEENARFLDVDRSHLTEPYGDKIEEKPELESLTSSPAGLDITEEARRVLGEQANQKVSLDFKEADLRDVIKQLHEWTGVNIVLDEAVLSEIDPTVTIYLSEVTLLNALEYIIRSKGLAYRLDKGVIFVSTRENLERDEGMGTRIYHLRKGLATHTEFSPEAMYTKRPTEEKAVSKQEDVIQKERTIEDILRESVSWPEGSRISLIERNGSLVVTNTSSNLEIIENILKAFDETPVQIMIEARFVEVGETALDELGVEWELKTDWGLVSVSGGNKLQLDKGKISQFPKLGSHKFDKEIADVVLWTQDSSGNWIASPPYASQNVMIDSTGSFDLTLGGILTSPQFEAVLHAIEQHEETNLLSSPKVTTLNGQEANIKVVTEYIYPTAYKTTSAEYNSAGIKVKDATSTPEKFVTRDAGILLKVIPRVGMDKKMINLTIIPEVSELKGWHNYGTAVTPYNQPIFESRKCITSIVVNDGDTVVLGGLIKENTEHIKDKIPLLGDIPILGALFRREYDRTEKRNLLIFVTAHILGPSGDLKH